MKKVITVRFKPAGKTYYFDPQGINVATGDYVIVETTRGVECAEVTQGLHDIADINITKPLKPTLRLADDSDIRKMKKNREEERNAFNICSQKIQKHKLDMSLVNVEYAFDHSKLLFYFTADNRVDFRELVKDLAAVFRTRIELRQIGVRDEAKMLGGLGLCGQPFCCSRFLTNFQPVSIKMAKEQGLSLNPTKISGCCGRLMCCLAYEQPAYDYLASVTPGVGSTVATPDGPGTVLEANLISGTLRILPERGDAAPKTYRREECRYIKGGKKKMQPEESAAQPK